MVNGQRGNILDLIGNTPLLDVSSLSPKPGVRLMAKMECFNPGGSVKDRIGLAMIEHAEETGALNPDKIILEATSGNTGIGLALVSAVKGYRILLALSEAVSVERRKILNALGADFLLTPGELGTDGAIEEAYALARENPDLYFISDQFNNEYNWRSHYLGTGPEIMRQTDGQVTHFVGTMGTTGTLMGISRYLKEQNPAIRIIGVEPYLGHRIQGLKNMKEAYQPGIFEKNRLDEKINVEDEAAFEMARYLAKKMGLFVGMSSGAAMHIAIGKARELEEGVIVVILPDGGERYLSTALFTVEKVVAPESKLLFFNSLTRKEEVFTPLKPGEVKIYTCGPTVYARPHLGMLRRVVAADLLRRYLEFSGYQVEHIMNITDIDDKTIAESERTGKPLKELTDHFTEAFLNDVDSMNCKRAAHYPKASEHIDDMVSFTERLVGRGVAYENLRSVYFNISKHADYGQLSGFDLGKIKVGATVDLDSYEKENPRDFTLLKRSTLVELKKGVSYKTRWGNIRPGWHVECAAMAMKYLGEEFDIHTASVDLIFPHHENEIAQCASLTGKVPAKYWLHNEMILDQGKKMSRSESVITTLRDLTDRGYTPREVRYFLLRTHYRQPIHFSEQGLEEARSALFRIDEFINKLEHFQLPEQGSDGEGLVREMEQGFVEAMNQDLNVSAALAALFNLIKKGNILLEKGKLNAGSAGRIIEALNNIGVILGLQWDEQEEALDEKVQALIARREAARQHRNWEEADQLRRELEGQGVMITDTAQGTRWRRKP